MNGWMEMEGQKLIEKVLAAVCIRLNLPPSIGGIPILQITEIADLLC